MITKGRGLGSSVPHFRLIKFSRRAKSGAGCERWRVRNLLPTRMQCAMQSVALRAPWRPTEACHAPRPGAAPPDAFSWLLALAAARAHEAAQRRRAALSEQDATVSRSDWVLHHDDPVDAARPRARAGARAPCPPAAAGAGPQVPSVVVRPRHTSSAEGPGASSVALSSLVLTVDSIR